MNDKKELTAYGASVGADDRQSIRNLYEDSITEKLEELNRKMRKMSDPAYLDTVNMRELYETVYEPKAPIIDGLLYPGTYILAGAPKLGKSFLVAQMAYHISTGTALWGYPVTMGTVLYLALEDDRQRLQSRMYQMYDMAIADRLYFATTAHQLGEGLDGQLEGFINEHPETRLIIIDTLQKVRETGGDKYSYASDYDIITKLKAFTAKFGICMILVHHTRKQKADDVFDMISGTNGLLGAADGAFLLHKEKRTSNAATLDISGRDQQDQRMYLTHDPQRLIWNLERKESEMWKEPTDPILDAVAKIVTSDTPSWNGSPTELATAIGTSMKPNTLTTRLNVNAGRLLSEYGIRYENSRSHSGRRISLSLEPSA